MQNSLSFDRSHYMIQFWNKVFIFWATVTFLVACTRLYNPLCPSVGWSVCLSVIFCFFGVFGRFWGYSCLAGLFHHCPCPSARNLGSRVSGLCCFSAPLLFFITPPFAPSPYLSLPHHGWESYFHVIKHDLRVTWDAWSLSFLLAVQWWWNQWFLRSYSPGLPFDINRDGLLSCIEISIEIHSRARKNRTRPNFSKLVRIH